MSESQELEELRQAAKEVIWAANRDPDEGPTGWAQAMSLLARLAFQMEDTVAIINDFQNVLIAKAICPACNKPFPEPGEDGFGDWDFPEPPPQIDHVKCPACGAEVNVSEVIYG